MNSAQRILIVDDETNVLNSLRRLFRPSGYETVTCSSAKEALDIIKMSKPFHVVISDFRMPEMNGVEFLTAVRACLPDSVRMVLSGYTDSGSVMAATCEGHIDKFIPKPWDDAFLLKSVADAMNDYASHQNNVNAEVPQANQSEDCHDRAV